MSKPSNRVPKLTIVTNGDDWEGLYLNGELVAENHRLELDDLAAALEIDIDNIEVSSEWLGGQISRLPDQLTDIPKDQII